ncbi:hypothetical protein B0T19DRAFT_291854 [Cercophora scortea]|uniref:Uncharacterized protein n=1 Tax=Cercophora scortea TaxID=314031 RepID=A0AAE0M376_9PEZI|nr:hypothetical protein B0T19DRAFT_291854 [Cercophora scortea]
MHHHHHHHPTTFLPLLLLTQTTQTTAQSDSGSFVGGDLTTQAPFNLSPSVFTALTTNATSNATFPITGYNTSLPAGPVDGTGTAQSGWSLSISVAADVPLSSSDDASLDKGSFTDATTLSLVRPERVGYNTSSWRVCAIVFTGGLEDAATDVGKVDGGCTALLPDDCIQQLQVNSVAGNTSRNGECEDLQVPDICGGYFGDGAVGSAYEIAADDDDDDDDEANQSGTRFFAAGSAPTNKGNASALAAVEKTVWPVLLTWTHFGANGQVHDSAGWLSCVRTPNTTAGALESSGSAAGRGVLWWGLLAGLAVAGWGACGLGW